MLGERVLVVVRVRLVLGERGVARGAQHLLRRGERLADLLLEAVLDVVVLVEALLELALLRCGAVVVVRAGEREDGERRAHKAGHNLCVWG